MQASVSRHLSKSCVRIRTVVGLGVALVCAAASAQYAPPDAKSKAAEKKAASASIVKSVDAKGRVVYSDHKVQGTVGQKVMRGRVFEDIPKEAPPAAQSGTAAAPAGNLVEWAQKQQAQMDEARKAANDINDKVAKQNCQNAKMSLSSLSSASRPMRMDEEGKLVPVSAEQIEADRAKAQEVIARDCK